MGIDINGWVEAKLPFYEQPPLVEGDDWKLEEDVWKPVLDLFWLYDVRDYDSFGCFFGVRNYAQFRPIAPERGLPVDVSAQVKKDAERSDGAFGQTWISWDEIKQIDWDEESVHVDERIHRYERNQQGELIPKGKALIEHEFAERVGYDQRIGDQEQEWDLGDVVYRRERMKRKDIKANWNELFHFLATLAARYGDECVRLVVWFE